MDINIQLAFMGFSIILGVIGIWKKIPILLMIGGALITFLWVFPMDFTNGSRVDTIQTVNNTHTVIWEDEPVDIEVYPKIFFGILGSLFMLAGAIIWKMEET